MSNQTDLVLEPVTGRRPTVKGSYVVYIDEGYGSGFADKRFLTWDGNDWFYPMSDQRFRGIVFGFIGPLPGMRLAAPVECQATPAEDDPEDLI